MMVLKGVLFLAICFSLIGCDGDEGEGGGLTIANASRLTSSGLTSQATCSANDCTPDNLTGRIFMAGAMLGGLDGEGYNMTFLANSEDIINDPSDPVHPEGTISFDLGQSTTVSGLISIPTADAMPTSPTVQRLETMFDYLDATITVSGTSSIDGTYVLRLVYRESANATDVGESMQWGDKLIRTPQETSFRWCDSTDCGHTTRPSSPLQSQDVLNSRPNGQMQGNPHYVGFPIELTTTLTVNYEQISCTDCLWAIDYDLTNSVAFQSHPSTFTSEKDIVNAFEIRHLCSEGGCQGTNDPTMGISATLTIGEAGSANQ